MKRRRVRMEIEVTRRRRGQIKSGKSSLASNQFPICSPQSGTLKRVSQSSIEKRRGRKEIVEKEDKKGNQKGRDRSSQ